MTEKENVVAIEKDAVIGNEAPTEKEVANALAIEIIIKAAEDIAIPAGTVDTVETHAMTAHVDIKRSAQELVVKKMAQTELLLKWMIPN